MRRLAVPGSRQRCDAAAGVEHSRSEMLLKERRQFVVVLQGQSGGLRCAGAWVHAGSRLPPGCTAMHALAAPCGHLQRRQRVLSPQGKSRWPRMLRVQVLAGPCCSCCLRSPPLLPPPQRAHPIAEPQESHGGALPGPHAQLAAFGCLHPRHLRYVCSGVGGQGAAATVRRRAGRRRQHPPPCDAPPGGGGEGGRTILLDVHSLAAGGTSPYQAASTNFQAAKALHSATGGGSRRAVRWVHRIVAHAQGRDVLHHGPLPCRPGCRRRSSRTDARPPSGTRPARPLQRQGGQIDVWEWRQKDAAVGSRGCRWLCCLALAEPTPRLSARVPACGCRAADRATTGEVGPVHARIPLGSHHSLAMLLLPAH